MENKIDNIFNPMEYAYRNPINPLNKHAQPGGYNHFSAGNDDEAHIELVVGRIEAAHVDVTQGYHNWRDIGFGMAASLGERGRTLYHRLSQISSQYDYDECDKQYSHCLSSHGSGVTIATFFQLAKDAGVDISYRTIGDSPISPSVKKVEMMNNPACEDEEMVGANDVATMKVRTFSSEILPKACSLITDIAAEGRDERERDMMLFTALVMLSCAFKNAQGVYDRRRVYPSLFGYVVTPSAGSKGKLPALYNLLRDIDDEIRLKYHQEMTIYQQALAEYQAQSKKNPNLPRPIEPPYRALRIPANGSSTATYQGLSSNDGWGVTLETEGDTMANALKSEYGNYSEGMRLAAHHESIQYSRRKDNEHVYIKEPKWSIMLTSTPDQLMGIFPSADNGLFSRFLFMLAPRDEGWHDVFADDGVVIEDVMAAIGKRVFAIHRKLEQLPKPLGFTLTPNQRKRFNKYFSSSQTEFYQMIDDNMIPTIRRLGLNAFRIMMILSIARLEEVDQWPDKLVCTDDDFEASLTIANALTEHAAQVYINYIHHKPIEDTDQAKLSPQKALLYNALPDSFDRNTYLQIAKANSITNGRAGNIISQLLLKDMLIERVSQGNYRKKTKQSKA